MKSRLPLSPVLLPAFAASLMLTGCNDARIVLCPSAAILADTASETVFRPGAPADPSGEAFTAYMTTAQTDCVFDKVQGITKSSLTLNFSATRPPSTDAASYTLPYFVAINQAERLISKKLYTIRISFAPGATIATAQDMPDQTEVDLERGHLPTDYQLLSGFQISEQQRAYNQKMGRYLPP